MAANSDIEPAIYNSPKRQMAKSLIQRVLQTCREYASVTTAHGFSYINQDGHSVAERIFWAVLVVLAVLFTSSQMSNLYNEWQNYPVITTLDTVSLPIEEVEFPAVTICPQGSVKKILDSVLFKQLKEYIGNKTSNGNSRVKRSISSGQVIETAYDGDDWKLTFEEMMVEAEKFLRDIYPGAKEKPTKLISVMTSKDPEKTLENKAVLHPEDENKCDPSTNADILNSLNKHLNNDSCPESFEMVEGLGCIHFASMEMTYNESNDYCKNNGGAQLLYFDSLENVNSWKEYNKNGNV